MNMWFEDLTECDYLETFNIRGVIAVGWLEYKSNFPTGKISKRIYSKLCKLAVEAELWGISHFLGYHECDICQFQGFLNNGELCIPYQNKIYICPLSIVHYINAHRYKPPEEFCQAVMTCPPLNTQKYKKQMIEAGGRNIFSIMSKNHENILKWIKSGEVKYFHMKNYEDYNRTN